jgi:hypothetical protein
MLLGAGKTGSRQRSIHPRGQRFRIDTLWRGVPRRVAVERPPEEAVRRHVVLAILHSFTNFSSYRTIGFGILAEHTAEVDGPGILDYAFEAARNLVTVESLPVAQQALHLGSNGAASLRQVP